MKQNNKVVVNIGWPSHASTEPGTGIYVRFQLYSCHGGGRQTFNIFQKRMHMTNLYIEHDTSEADYSVHLPFKNFDIPVRISKDCLHDKLSVC